LAMRKQQAFTGDKVIDEEIWKHAHDECFRSGS
jgi:hypothetical protein